MISTEISKVKVSLQFSDKEYVVGYLLQHHRQIFFEYESVFLESGIEISPFKLPLKKGVFSFEDSPFDKLPGVFNDSLPDGWGRLLLDRKLNQLGIDYRSVGPLYRLCVVGRGGMGALRYEPYVETSNEKDLIIDLDKLQFSSDAILNGELSNHLDTLFKLNGSSAGARPKVLVGVSDDKQRLFHGYSFLSEDFESWIIKFTNSQDHDDSGAIEYVYSQMAALAGIDISSTYLFPSANSLGYFGTCRFDRQLGHSVHVHSLCGVLHSNFRVPVLDYKDVLDVTMALTKDRRDVLKLFRLAVFNVCSHNRDDHSKNFSYVMNEKGVWKCAPAYDLTFSYGPGGEQSMMVMGEGKFPTFSHLERLAHSANLSQFEMVECISKVSYALSQWDVLAKDSGIKKDTITRINKHLLIR